MDLLVPVIGGATLVFTLAWLVFGRPRWFVKLAILAAMAVAVVVVFFLVEMIPGNKCSAILAVFGIRSGGSWIFLPCLDVLVLAELALFAVFCLYAAPSAYLGWRARRT